MSKRKQKKSFMAYLDTSLVRELDNLGFWSKKSRSAMISEAIRSYVDRARIERYEGNPVPSIPEEP